MKKEVREVYYVNSKANIEKLWKALDFEQEGRIGIKTHFGEKGNITYPDPKIIKFFASKLKNPVLIECNNLSKGLRGKASTHKKLAREHGFNFAPIDICDGEDGKKITRMKINLKNVKIAKIGKSIKKYSTILGIAHFKGHEFTGFGGTFKNIGVGLAAKPGKKEIHASESSNQAQEKIVEYVSAILKNKKCAFVNLVVNITKECDCCGRKMETIMKDIGFLASKDPVALEQASYDLCKKQNKKDIFKKMHKVDGTHLIKYAQKIGLGNSTYNLIKLD